MVSMTKRAVLSGIFTQDSQHKSAFTDAKWVLQYTNKIHKWDDIFKPEETDENAPAGGQLAIKRKLDQVQDVLGALRVEIANVVSTDSQRKPKSMIDATRVVHT